MSTRYFIINWTNTNKRLEKHFGLMTYTRITRIAISFIFTEDISLQSESLGITRFDRSDFIGLPSIRSVISSKTLWILEFENRFNSLSVRLLSIYVSLIYFNDVILTICVIYTQLVGSVIKLI